MAVNLLEDAFRGLTDSMVIVSGDSDLEPAVEWVRRNYPHVKITVYIPVLENEREDRRNHNYHRMGVTCKPLPLAAAIPNKSVSPPEESSVAAMAVCSAVRNASAGAVQRVPDFVL